MTPALIVLLPLAMCAGIGIVAIIANAITEMRLRRAQRAEIEADVRDFVTHRR